MSTSQSSPDDPAPELVAARNRFIQRVGRIMNNVEDEFGVYIGIESFEFKVIDKKDGGSD